MPSYLSVHFGVRARRKGSPSSRSRAGRGLATVTVFTVVLALPCLAQNYRPDESRHGTLTVKPDAYPGIDELPQAQRRAALGVAGQLLDIFRRDSAITAPVGYTVDLARIVGTRRGELGRDPGMPYYTGVVGTYWAFFLRDGKPVRYGEGPTPFNAYVNTLWACRYEDDVANEDLGKPMRDGGPPILVGIRQTGEYRGHPIYNGQCVVITNRSEPPFIPVTRERYMKLELLGMRAKMDRFRSQIDYQHLDSTFRAAFDQSMAEGQKIIAAREAELARMSDADRAAPAAVRRNGVSDSTLVAPTDPDALPLVTINPAFFDRSLPPSVPQVLFVNIPFMQHGVTPWGASEEPERRAHAERIRDMLDWAALEGVVKP